MKKSPLCDGLMVTPDGDVIGPKGKTLKGRTGSDGYWYVSSPRVDGKRRKIAIHRLVAAAYCDGYAPGLQVNHRNGIKKDNRAINLEWVTPKQNTSHAIETGLFNNRGEANYRSKITGADVVAIVAMVRGGARQKDVAARFGIAISNVSEIASGKKWRHIPRDPSNDAGNEVECMAEKNIATLQQNEKLRGAETNRRGGFHAIKRGGR